MYGLCCLTFQLIIFAIWVTSGLSPTSLTRVAKRGKCHFFVGVTNATLTNGKTNSVFQGSNEIVLKQLDLHCLTNQQMP